METNKCANKLDAEIGALTAKAAMEGAAVAPTMDDIDVGMFPWLPPALCDGCATVVMVVPQWTGLRTEFRQLWSLETEVFVMVVVYCCERYFGC